MAGKSEYDRSVGTWSPAGRLFQLEYAIQAIKLGTTAIGLVTKEGVLLVVEKKLANSLIVPKTIQKVFEIDHHVGCATAGLLADARMLVDHARNEAQSHWFTYNEPLSIESCVNAIADLALDFADVTDGRRKKTMSRPFGVAMLVGGVNDDGKPALWVTDPSGTCTEYTAAAIGSAQEGATSLLSEQYKADMTLAEAEIVGVGILRQMMEEKMTTTNIEVAKIPTSTKKYHLYSAAEIESVINRLPAPLEY
ncbi:unnamed protein product [Amoebophrya sp. A120]|nr:unnamed protein product [Amoebophrya sp. A120]|eukprot:GSA120T00021802001.1